MGAKVLDFFGFHCPVDPGAVHILNPKHWVEMWDRASSLGLYAGLFVGSVSTLVLVGFLFMLARFVASLVRGSQ